MMANFLSNAMKFTYAGGEVPLRMSTWYLSTRQVAAMLSPSSESVDDSDGSG